MYKQIQLKCPLHIQCSSEVNEKLTFTSQTHKFWDINTKLGLLAYQINKKNKNKKMSVQLADSERREADRKTDLKKIKKTCSL